MAKAKQVTRGAVRGDWKFWIWEPTEEQREEGKRVRWRINRWAGVVAEGEATNFEEAKKTVMKIIGVAVVESALSGEARGKLKMSIKRFEHSRQLVTAHVLWSLGEGSERDSIVNSVKSGIQDFYTATPSWFREGLEDPETQRHPLTKTDEQLAAKLVSVYTQLGIVGEKAKKYGFELYGDWFLTPANPDPGGLGYEMWKRIQKGQKKELFREQMKQVGEIS